MNVAAKDIAPERLLAVVAAVAKEARPHVESVLRVQREFGVSLPAQAPATSESPRDLLRYVLGSAGQEARDELAKLKERLLGVGGTNVIAIKAA